MQLSAELLNKIYSPIFPALVQVQEELKLRLTDISGNPVPGKYLRPALSLFASHAFEDIDHSESVRLATALELIHNASLIHDDILDDTAMRRTGPALHIPLGIRKAVLFGDYIFARGLELVRDLNRPPILSTIVNSIKTMCEGQWKEANIDGNKDFSKDLYLEIIQKKTAVLFACSCHCGALLRKADEREIDAFYQFGLQFGMAYQLLDDYDDLVNNPQDLIILKLIELGGADYCYPLAKEYLKKTRNTLSPFTNPIVQESYNSLVDCLEESYRV